MINSRLHRDLTRSIRNWKYEYTEVGLYLPEQKLSIGGMYVVDVNGEDITYEPNIVVDEGKNHILEIVIANGTQVATWYMAPYSGNVSPVAGWTAANFTANSTEFTNYTGTRQAFVESTPSAGSINNTSNKAAFTIEAGGGTVWGCGLLSDSPKSAVTGTLLSAAQFASERTLVETDILNIGYTLTLTST